VPGIRGPGGSEALRRTCVGVPAGDGPSGYPSLGSLRETDRL